MARASRHYIPGHAWQITHCCHKKEFLSKFAKDRQGWLDWFFEAKKPYGIVILNYMATSNHNHLLVHDRDEGQIMPKRMQLAAGQTAQEYDQREGGKGAFWGTCPLGGAPGGSPGQCSLPNSTGTGPPYATPGWTYVSKMASEICHEMPGILKHLPYSGRFSRN
jgi:hypothetical protein